MYVHTHLSVCVHMFMDVCRYFYLGKSLEKTGRDDFPFYRNSVRGDNEGDKELSRIWL